MTDTQERTASPKLQAGPLMIGAALVGVGALAALAGWAVGAAHVMSVTRQRIREMEVPPGELAKMKWAQARKAAAAGTQAWQNGSPARERAGI
jgi:hypothetical protein